jgi:hypothetical protein
MKKNNWSHKIILLIILVTMANAYSCSKAPNSTMTVQNPDSDLLKLLLREDDFNEGDWKLDYQETLQSDKSGNGEMLESATYWVTANYVPLGQFFRVSHNILKYRTGTPKNTEELIVFNGTPDYIEDINSTDEIDSAKCGVYNNSKYEECIYVKQYAQYISIVVVSTSKDLKESTLLDILSPLFHTINERFLAENR